jgi:hypothetical protein
MSTSGEIDLSNLKAKYDIEDIQLVDSRKLEAANDARLYFEISFALGLTFLGALLNGPYNTYLLLSTLAFLVFGAFFIWRFWIKNKEAKPMSKINGTEEVKTS